MKPKEILRTEEQLLSYRVHLMWAALVLNLLVVWVIFMEESGRMDMFHLRNDCVETDAIAIAFGSTFLPLLIAWVLPSRPVSLVHFVAVFIWVVLMAAEGFFTLMMYAFCDGMGMAFG
jgi:hypothetical protein